MRKSFCVSMMPQTQKTLLGLVLSEVVAAWRIRWVRRALYIFVPLMCVGCLCFWLALTHTLRTFDACTDHNSQSFLDSLCGLHMYGRVAGSLCEPLCVSREIQFKRCLGHGVKLHVLEAEWNANTIILKAPHEIGSRRALEHVKYESKIMQLSREEFIQKASDSLFRNVAGNSYTKATMKLAEEIFEECDLLQDGILEYNEAVTCWQLVETDEYVMYSLLQGKDGIPDVYGVCGQLYAVQYAASEPFLGFDISLSDYRPWEFRARLAIGLLDMIESIEETPFGPLHLCDVQEPNFGVVRRDGRLLAKAIDVDISFFQNQLELVLKSEMNNSCSSDSDCGFISCEVPCNSVTGKCSGRLVSNNFQTLCKKILRKHSAYHSALLADPPKDIQLEIGVVLDKCAAPGSAHISRVLLQELRTLLERSLHF